MTDEPLLEFTANYLSQIGYKRIKTPLTVAAVRFEFPAALVGSGARASDLVLLIDTSMSDGSARIGERTQQRLEALSRALDIAGSHLALTTVLVGASLPTSVVETIARGVRVLSLSEDPRQQPTADADQALLRFKDSLRVLMPLELGVISEITADPLGKVATLLPAPVRTFAQPFIELSARGEREVEREITDLLERQLSQGLTG